MSNAAVSTIVIDNWYSDPDAIRRHALMRIEADGVTGASKRDVGSRRRRGPKWEPYPGTRCKGEMGNLAWNFDMMQRVCGMPIDPSRWCFMPSVNVDIDLMTFDPARGGPVIKDTPITINYEGISNGTFAMTDTDSIWRVHSDLPNQLAAVIYLTPDAPIDTGTSFYRHKETGATSMHGFTDIDKYDAYEPDKWEEIDRIGNVYNRCIIFDANRYHCATKYTDERLFQVFFFDILNNDD